MARVHYLLQDNNNRQDMLYKKLLIQNCMIQLSKRLELHFPLCSKNRQDKVYILFAWWERKIRQHKHNFR